MLTKDQGQAIGSRPEAASQPGGHDIVRVITAPVRRQRAVCTCGWRGRRRLLRSRTVFDALTHAAHTGCHPAVPLVIGVDAPWLLDIDIGHRP